MDSGNMTISKDVNDHLGYIRRNDESFGEEIMRLTEYHNNDFSGLIGIKIEVIRENMEKEGVLSNGDRSREEMLF